MREMEEEGAARAVERLLEWLVGERDGIEDMFPRMEDVEVWDLEGEDEVREEVKATGPEMRMSGRVVDRRGGEERLVEG